MPCGYFPLCCDVIISLVKTASSLSSQPVCAFKAMDHCGDLCRHPILFNSFSGICVFEGSACFHNLSGQTVSEMKSFSVGQTSGRDVSTTRDVRHLSTL